MSHGGDDGIPEEHEEHVNHEAWVIPYADLLTLLMAMFIALFAMSSVDLDKFKELSIGFNEALGGGELSTGVFDPTDGGAGPLDGQGSGLTERIGGEVGPDRQPESNRVVAELLDAVPDGAGPRVGAGVVPRRAAAHRGGRESRGASSATSTCASRNAASSSRSSPTACSSTAAPPTFAPRATSSCA
ncbi:MAG: hypothetical protein KatS3mg010_1485 [Acidimicrobiia bacterium]|nr:MAG: hypothetical protein KatS3mg010_1485 [Acidimicrobiia bacterium]